MLTVIPDPTILVPSQIARFMGPTFGPSGADRTQVGPMMAPWTLLSGMSFKSMQHFPISDVSWLDMLAPNFQQINKRWNNQLIMSMGLYKTDVTPVRHTCTATCRWLKNSCNQCNHCAIKNCVFGCRSIGDWSATTIPKNRRPVGNRSWLVGDWLPTDWK